jgi:hypothetical protein
MQRISINADRVRWQTTSRINQSTPNVTELESALAAAILPN